MFWRKYPRRAPKKSGRYLCTICRPCYKNDFGEVFHQAYVMILFYDAPNDRFIDMARQAVFSKYKVFSDDQLSDVLTSDSLVDRTDQVSAWKKLGRAQKDIDRLYYDGNVYALMKEANRIEEKV